jgi:hypothetical protein
MFLKKIGLIITLLFFTYLFTGCSWQQYFVLKNTSANEITIEYVLNSTEGFPIFNDIPTAYALDNNSRINWEKSLTISDTDNSKLVVNLKLPSYTAIIIGTLSNDNYIKYDQEFINGRIFNLKTIKITTKEQVISINQQSFDTYFANHSGYIEYSIK